MPISTRARELVIAAAEAASDKLAEDIVAFDVSEQLVITDAFVICSAPNDRQVKAIVDGVQERLRDLGAKPVRREGEREGRWVLLDYIDVIVHMQTRRRGSTPPRPAVEGLPTVDCPTRYAGGAPPTTLPGRRAAGAAS